MESWVSLHHHASGISPPLHHQYRPSISRASTQRCDVTGQCVKAANRDAELGSDGPVDDSTTRQAGGRGAAVESSPPLPGPGLVLAMTCSPTTAQASSPTPSRRLTSTTPRRPVPPLGPRGSPRHLRATAFFSNRLCLASSPPRHTQSYIAARRPRQTNVVPLPSRDAPPVSCYLCLRIPRVAPLHPHLRSMASIRRPSSLATETD